MKNEIFSLNVCRCKENRVDLVKDAIYIENKHHNCNNCGYYQNYDEITVEIDKNNKVVWSTI